MSAAVRSSLRLRSLMLRLPRQPGPLRPQILAALRRHGRPLRWAITAVETAPDPALDPAEAATLLRVEAVVCEEGSVEPQRPA